MAFFHTSVHHNMDLSPPLPDSSVIEPLLGPLLLFRFLTIADASCLGGAFISCSGLQETCSSCIIPCIEGLWGPLSLFPLG